MPLEHKDLHWLPTYPSYPTPVLTARTIDGAYHINIYDETTYKLYHTPLQNGLTVRLAQYPTLLEAQSIAYSLANNAIQLFSPDTYDHHSKSRVNKYLKK